ncbi:uncharacterized protein HD556DRAFT_1277141 [Suillus plorans]|uniref:Tat pathway signal sequence n=1 Tax=Suillus plorans TaxID=116603 RepID=A0A9P7AEN3_9AGAM|nr:uncharacterized protein HD556DRAFT_1277141 [Suillus plorans]KAG1787748.1 hypothetical protein HD556DRAFT_1277141 [Suillus plorans]
MSITLWFFIQWARSPSMDDVVIYSSVNEAIESIGIIKFNGSFNAPSIYRGTPSPELDAIWDRVSLDVRPLRMTHEQLLRTGEKPSPSMARYPDEYGGGYVATVEVIHQLHCLDMLRKASWGNEYHKHGGMNKSHEASRTHLDHCIEILRQLTMCSGDVTMITHDWIEGRATPFADFNVPHKCRNFEKILDWIDEHRVFIPKSKWVRLEDNVDLPSLP